MHLVECECDLNKGKPSLFLNFVEERVGLFVGDDALVNAGHLFAEHNIDVCAGALIKARGVGHHAEQFFV